MRLAIRVAILTVTIWAMSGCSSAPPAEWMLYSRAAYLYGRAQAFTQIACEKPEAAKTVACVEGQKIQDEVHTLNPLIQDELSKNKPDWAKIMQFMDLAVGLASKVPMLGGL